MILTELGLILVYSCIFLSHVACEQNEETVGLEFLNKIKSNVALHQEYVKSKDKHFYTIFRVIGKKMEIEEFSDLYQSVCVGGKLKEMVTIITIRNLNVYEPYNVEKYTENMMSCIQKHIDGREDALNDIGLTVNYINASTIPDIDMLNSTLRKTYDKYELFDELVLEFFYEICFDVLQKMFEWRLKDSLCEFSIEDINNNMGEYDLNDWHNIQFDAIIEYVKKQVDEGCLLFDEDKKYLAKHSSFSNAIDKLLEQETESDKVFLEAKRESYHNLLIYFIRKKYSILFKQGIYDIASKYIPILKEDINKQTFYDYYVKICRGLSVYFRYYRNFNAYDRSPSVGNYCKEEKYTTIIHDYFVSIKSDAVREAFNADIKPTIDILRQEICSKNITTILYNGKITNEAYYPLIDALKDMALFAKLHKDQFICIDNGIAMTENEAKISIEICDAIDFESSACVKTVDFTLMIKPANEKMECTQLQKFTYRRDVSNGNDKVSISYNDANIKSIQTTITINEYDHEHETTLQQHLKPLFSICLTNNNSVIVDTHFVTIFNELGSSFIHILRHRNQVSDVEMISLIYDMHTKAKDKKLKTPDQLNRLIKCLDDVPGSILNSLCNFLQVLPLKKGCLCTIPNLCRIDSLDLTFIENTTEDEKWNDASQKLSVYITGYCYRHGHIQVKEYISLKQITEFESKKTFNCEFVKWVVSRLKTTEAELHRILLKFVSGKIGDSFTDFDQNDASKNAGCPWVEVYVSEHDDNSVILHISVVKSSCYIRNILINPITLLTSTVNNKFNSLTLNLIEEGMEYINSKITFLAKVFSDICREMEFTVNFLIKNDIDLQMKICIGILYSNIEKLLKKLQNMNNNDYSNMKPIRIMDPIEFQKAIKPNEIEHLAEKIVHELSNLAKKKNVNVTSIKINRQKEDYDRDTKSNVADRIMDQYENLGCWKREDYE